MTWRSIVKRMALGALARSTVRAIALNGFRLLAQAASLVVLARHLGPIELGAFIGVSGMAATVGVFSGLGTGLVMYQEVASRRAGLGGHWRLSSGTIAGAGVAIGSVGAILAVWLFGDRVSPVAITMIFVADVALAPFLANAAFAMAATERVAWAAALPAGMAAIRAVGVVLFVYGSSSSDVESYSVYYLAATAVAAVASFTVVHVSLRPRLAPIPPLVDQVRRGLGFMAVSASQTALGSLDKTLVLKFGGADIAGLYGPAYRAATLLAFPVDSMAMAAMPRLFQKFGGVKNHRGLVTVLFAITFSYGVAAAAVLWVAAPLMPLLFGPEYLSTIEAVRWLSLFVPFFALRSLGGMILMAARRKRLRAATEGSGLIVMAVLGTLMLPKGGLLGAVTMITAVEAAIACSHWFAIYRLRIQMPSNHESKQCAP